MIADCMTIQLRWSDLDPNFHVRHSVYYDWGATSRIGYLTSHGLPVELMQQLHIGPILFREECLFRREVRWGDVITIGLEVVKARKDFSRWTIRHIIYKNEEIIAAIITIDGAWINTKERKLAIPTQEIIDVFSKMPRADDFEWEVKSE